MRKINRFCWLAALPLAFTACQNQDFIPDEPVVGKSGTVEATIGKQIQTRVQVEYGNEDETKGELFTWTLGDLFKIFDAQNPGSVDDYMFYFLSDSYDESRPSSHATFEPFGSYSLTNGHEMVAFVNVSDNFIVSDNTVTVESVNLEGAGTQLASGTPGNADIAHLKSRLPLYATATVKEDGTLPALTFHHLSSLFRYSLTNRMNSDVKIKNVTVTMTGKHFIMDAHIAVTGAGVVSIPSKAVTSNTHTLNFKTSSSELYATIASDKTYNGYSIFIPDKDVTFGTGETLSFTVTTTDGTSETTSNAITLDASKIAAANGGTQYFEVGKRYWFDLTIDTDGTLKWTKDVAK